MDGACQRALPLEKTKLPPRQKWPKEKEMVRDRGIEPLTPSVSRKCSSTELTAQLLSKGFRNWLVSMAFQRLTEGKLLSSSRGNARPKKRDVRTKIRIGSAPVAVSANLAMPD